MSLPIWATICLGIFGIINFAAAIIISSEHEGGRVDGIIESFFKSPYRDGIRLGHILAVVFLFPAIALNMVVFGSIPFVFDTVSFICNVRITKPRPKK